MEPFPFHDKDRLVAHLKDDAIFSLSQSQRRRSVLEIAREAERPIQVIEEIIESLPEGDGFKVFCLAAIEKIRNDAE
jgi:hypothetical protein